MLKVLILTRSSSSATELFLQTTLSDELCSAGCDVYVDNCDDGQFYDLVICSSAIGESEIRRRCSLHKLVALADPKPAQLYLAELVDFLIVCSIEQREYFCQHNTNAIIYPMVPSFTSSKVFHRDKDFIVLAYHGNLHHLNASLDTMLSGVNMLAQYTKVELRCIYNIDLLGKWSVGDSCVSPNVTLKHLQWYPDCYEEYLNDVDIGLLPGLVENKRLSISILWHYFKYYLSGCNKYDFSVRYKATSNYGRALIFAGFGIPVVAEATPSMSQLIHEGVDGFIVLNNFGWFRALKALAGDVHLRTRLGSRFYSNYGTSHFLRGFTEGLINYVTEHELGSFSHPRERLSTRGALVVGFFANFTARLFQKMRSYVKR